MTDVFDLAEPNEFRPLSQMRGGMQLKTAMQDLAHEHRYREAQWKSTKHLTK